jgi:hypothetical protein
MTMESTLQKLNRLAGSWTTEATHPAAPGVVVRGTVVTEWLEGKQFLIQRSRNDHPDFPDAISIIGATDRDRVGESAPQPARPSLTMHYFDSRGVFRVYQVDVEANAWTIWREAPGFSQRFKGTFIDGDTAIDGLWQMCEDGSHWHDDLRIQYRRT